MRYQELKNDKYSLNIIAQTLNDDENFKELLQEIALKKQWMVAKELGMQPAYLSVMITTIKACKGL